MLFPATEFLGGLLHHSRNLNNWYNECVQIPWTIYVNDFLFLSYYCDQPQKAKGMIMSLTGLIYSFIQHILIACLLCARQCAWCWGTAVSKQPLPS